MEALDSLYKEIILEHNKEPRNFGTLDHADLIREGYNPLCGDRISVQLKLSPDRFKILKCQFQGEGCSICMASASIMTEEVTGMNVKEAQGKIQEFRDLMQGKKDPDEFEGDVEALAGVRRFPVRIKCALLGWTTLKDALDCSPGCKEEDHGICTKISSTE